MKQRRHKKDPLQLFRRRVNTRIPHSLKGPISLFRGKEEDRSRTTRLKDTSQHTANTNDLQKFQKPQKHRQLELK